MLSKVSRIYLQNYASESSSQTMKATDHMDQEKKFVEIGTWDHESESESMY